MCKFSMKQPSLYLVTNRKGLYRNNMKNRKFEEPPGQIPDSSDLFGIELEVFFHIIRASIEGGVKIVQLREKDSSAREIINIGKKLLSVLKPLGIPLIINDRVDVAHAVGADGVHLGQSDLTVAEARAILGKKAIIGLSVESLEQARVTNGEEVDYLAASPIFSTKTKPDCNAPWGLDGLKQLCAFSKHPVIAIGGIDETNAKQIIECGAAGVAIVSAIFNATCPKSAALQILNRMHQ